MFNKELFYDLCNKYGVELSDEYSKPMIKTDGEVRQLEEQDVRSSSTISGNCFLSEQK